MFNIKEIINKYKLDYRLVRDLDRPLLFSSIIISLFGIMNIYLCTKGGIDTYGPLHFVIKQVMAFILSLIVMYFIITVDYRKMYNYIDIFYWICIILLAVVWIPGIGKKINGARCWINLGFGNMQPAELARIAIILMLSKILDEIDCKFYDIKNLSKMAFYVGLPVLMIVKQPDMGMGMVCFFIVLGIMFIAGLDNRIIGGGFLAILIAIVLLWNTNLIKPHQKARITEFMNSETDDSKEGYQLNQGLVGIGSGGIFGARPSLSMDGVEGYAATHVPEIETDFIFATTAENWGLLGAITLLGLYSLLILRMIFIAKKSKDRFASFVCIGIVSYFLFAITQNIGMLLRLLPITGITLPLMSFGGTSLLTTMMMIALVLNIGMRSKEIHF